MILRVYGLCWDALLYVPAFSGVLARGSDLARGSGLARGSDLAVDLPF